MNILNDKGNKALKPLLTAIKRFNLPVKTSIKLFHTHIAPILLYNTENWITFSEGNLKKFDKSKLWTRYEDSKIDITHRKFLKNILGVSRSTPSLAVYGETGEVPLSLKSYRLSLNYWHRLANLPDTCLAKKALIEHIQIRTKWIETIEKIIGNLNVADKIDNSTKFKNATKKGLEQGFLESWKEGIKEDFSRLNFYKKIKPEFGREKYLQTLSFEQRRVLSKLKCSDHQLEIEKGRHKGIERFRRVCPFCPIPLIEDENHLIFECQSYNTARTKYRINEFSITDLFSESSNILASFCIEAFEERKKHIELFLAANSASSTDLVILI